MRPRAGPGGRLRPRDGVGGRGKESAETRFAGATCNVLYYIMTSIKATGLHPRLELPAGLALALFEAAARTARAATKAMEARPTARPRRGLTLRPGRETPLWNELVAAAGPWLNQRGSKAQLARILGVPRQRLHDCLKAGSACLDAERALLLLCWIAARQQGRELTA